MTDTLPAPASSLRLIDDMEHSDATLPIVPPGSSSFFWKSGLGNWFVTSSDGMGGDAHIDEIVPPSPYGKKACHVTGGQSQTPAVRVDLWAQLNHPTGAPVDLGAYIGVAFRARLRSTTGRLTVALNDVAAGANFFNAESSLSPWPSRTVTPVDWERVVVLFEDFSTAPQTSGASSGRSPRLSNISSIDFVVGDGHEQFDLWLDELALVCKGPCSP